MASPIRKKHSHFCWNPLGNFFAFSVFPRCLSEAKKFGWWPHEAKKFGWWPHDPLRSPRACHFFRKAAKNTFSWNLHLAWETRISVLSRGDISNFSAHQSYFSSHDLLKQSQVRGCVLCAQMDIAQGEYNDHAADTHMVQMERLRTAQKLKSFRSNVPTSSGMKFKSAGTLGL